MRTPTFTEVRCVGMHFRGAEAVAMAEALLPGDEVQLEREPDNQFDENAIKVMLHGQHIGYIAKNIAAFMAGYMDDGHQFQALIEGRTGQYPLLTVGPVPADAA